MKTLLVFVLGVAVGASAFYLCQTQTGASATASHVGTSAREMADRAIEKTRAAAANVSDALARKMEEWHLTPAEIRSELAKTGAVVRENTARARERVTDARIIAVIKAKFVLDRDLSANAIDVDCRDGSVTLSGTVASETLIGRAVALALDTAGVHHVTSKLAVQPSGPAR